MEGAASAHNQVFSCGNIQKAFGTDFRRDKGIYRVLWLDFEKTFPHNLDGQVLKSVFQKFKNDENLEEAEEQEVIKFIDTFVTCTLDKEKAKKLLIRECGDKDAIAAKAVEIARTVNKHRHNKSCRKYNTKCRFNYPKFPSVRTMLTKNPEVYYKDDLLKCDTIEEEVSWLNKKMATIKIF